MSFASLQARCLAGAALLLIASSAAIALEATPPEPVLAAVAAREYHATAHAEGLQAPNRAQQFRTRFDRVGIAVVDREDAARDLLRLDLVRWGRADALASAPPAAPTAIGARVERRSGPLTEWYVNSPDGLEHGFDVAAPPAGTGPLEFHLASDRPITQADADAVVFGTGANALRYAHLKVWDADGRILPATMQVAGDQHLVIRVDDAGARYPVTVDPLLSGTADITRTGNQAGAQFGIRMADAGDVNNDGFDDLVVGAFRFDTGTPDTGAAFVYYGPGFTTATQLTGSQGDSAFGAGVGGAGDLNNDGFDDVVIGAPNFDFNGISNAGAAFVFFGNAGAIDTTPDATIYCLNTNCNLGAAVSGVGDVNNDGFDDLALGGPRYNPGGRVDAGAVFVYFGGNTFTTSLDAILGLDEAGYTVGTAIAARSGDVNGDGIDDVVIGAAGYEAPGSGFTNEGAAVVYFGGNNTLDTAPDAILRTGVNGAGGGASVALGDFNGDGVDDVLAGAPLATTSGATQFGGYAIWYGGTGSIDTVADVTRFGTEAGEQFGRSVAVLSDIDGDGRDEIAVGSPSAIGGGSVVTGKVSLYFPTAAGVPAAASLQLLGGQAAAAFGTSLASGDFNNDGASDLAVGEPLRDVGVSLDSGAFQLYLGQPNEVFKNSFE